MVNTTQHDTQPSSRSGELLREGLSALMDGEAGELELQRILKECGQDDALRDTWRRYHLASALLRQQAVEQACRADMAERVAGALVADGSSTVARPRSGWWPDLARMAVAASVAGAVVVGMQWQQRQSAAVVASAPMQPVIQAPQTVVVSPAPLLSGQQQVGAANAQRQQAQFDRYLQYHLERASLNDSRGMVPLARQVSEGDR